MPSGCGTVEGRTFWTPRTQTSSPGKASAKEPVTTTVDGPPDWFIMTRPWLPVVGGTVAFNQGPFVYLDLAWHGVCAKLVVKGQEIGVSGGDWRDLESVWKCFLIG